MAEEAPATCILLRVRRVTVEDTYINVPVGEAIMKSEAEPDGTYRIDPGAFMREGLRLAGDPSVEWRHEGEPAIELHPTQQPLPAGRVPFDVHRR